MNVGITVAIIVPIILMIAAGMQRKVNEKGGCPECGTPVPRFRRPTSLRQALWGGWTCSNCSTEMDRFGDEIAQA
ncbi:MAG: hypothetical protein KIT61_17900 [Pyrinomonadaceae bacterium]|nr:hypothetical protein [Pyrinomonadaceae bacterium]